MEIDAEKRDNERIEPLAGPDIRLFIQGKVRGLINISDNIIRMFSSNT